MRINIHAGHGTRDSKSQGAVGLINESTEARKVKNEVIRILKLEGHAVFDCTVDYPSSANDCLNKIVSKCNTNKVDIDISIHFNSGSNDRFGNDKSTGVEVFTYDSSGIAYDSAKRICDNVSKLGFRNRGVKQNKDLYVLRNTYAPALLVECCFVDDKDDVNLYDYKSMAKAIAEGILNKTINETKEDHKPVDQKYAVLINSYSDIAKARMISHMIKEDDNLFNEVITYNNMYAIKIYPLSPISKAENIQKLVKDKYNAYSDIIEI